MRALRGQSGFNEGRAADSGFSVGVGGGGGGGGGFQFQPLGAPTMQQALQSNTSPQTFRYTPPNQAYAPLGAPPA